MGRTEAAAAAAAPQAHKSERRLFYGCFALLGATMAVSHFLALPVLLQMVVYTFPIVYIGSHASLRQNEVDEVTGEKSNKGEAMNHTDAMLFPVFGSVALFS
ncbi:putative minor histocompatibility antigen h13, partial [Toxoplasma gondii CAST]